MNRLSVKVWSDKRKPLLCSVVADPLMTVADLLKVLDSNGDVAIGRFGCGRPLVYRPLPMNSTLPFAATDAVVHVMPRTRHLPAVAED